MMVFAFLIQNTGAVHCKLLKTSHLDWNLIHLKRCDPVEHA